MKKTLLFCLISVFIYACGPSSESADNSGSNVSNALGMKSGIIKYKCTMDGSSDFQVIKYFKDEGNAFHIETTIDAMGQTMLNHELYLDSYYYNYVDGVDEGTKSKLGSEAFLKEKQMGSESDIIKAGGKKVGTEKVLDKECNVYEINEFGVESKKWIWGNLLLKSEAGQVKMEAIEIKETTDFPAEIFNVPTKINFKES